MSAVGLCFLAAGTLAAQFAGLETFTLAWTHSVEKIPWEEDWVVEGPKLRLVAARVRGSGAGMEPPPQAVRMGDTWQWQPDLAPLAEVVLRRSGATEDYRLCPAGRDCVSFSRFLPSAADPATMVSCASLAATPPR